MNYFITNREVVGKDKRQRLREDGREHAGDNLRFGTYDIDTRKFSLFGEPKKETDLIYSGIIDKNTNRLKGSTRFFKDIYCKLTDNKYKGDVLFFIHGFNTDLDGVRDNFETLNKIYVDNKKSPINHIVIFTWPGRTPIIPFHYHDDKKDAMRSGEALARGFKKVINFFRKFLLQDQNKACEQHIHLMLHSMGHRVFKHTLLEMEKKKIQIPELFSEITLMAADIEYNIFDDDNAFENLIDFGSRIHIFYHKNDRVLDISKYTKNFSNRLGRHGRKRLDIGMKNIFDIDVTNTNDDEEYGLREDLLNHWYYYSSSEVVNKLIDIFNGK
ncbi:MAG: alpha/beta hydrolase [Flavobacteriales bacterium]|nr:alpha/beta hydrolase [Flavobacteriales bacterium]